jgi:hypothetical protein
MDADTFIVIALEAYAVLVAVIAAVAIAVARRRTPSSSGSRPSRGGCDERRVTAV